MAWNRSWRGWIVAPFGLLAAGIVGYWLLQFVNRQPLFATPEEIPSVTQADSGVSSSKKWAGPVDRARRAIRAAMAGRNLPAISAAVGFEGKVVWAEGFGWADVESRAPVTPDTPFRIGTASTLLTSAAAGLLLESGKLALDNDIRTYVPQLPARQSPVTLRQLMANTGGIAGGGEEQGQNHEGDPLARQRCEAAAQALPHFANAPSLFQPGAQYRPSNHGWILVSAAVESAANGQRLPEFLNGRIFRPAGMNHTGTLSTAEENPEGIGEEGEDAPPVVFVRDVILKPLGVVDSAKPRPPAAAPATLYQARAAVGPLLRYGLRVAHARNVSCFSGSLAFQSTPSDLVRFGMAAHDGTLLQPATVQLLQTPQQLSSGQPTGHALGWDLHNVRFTGGELPAMAVGADGVFLGGKVATLLRFRDSGIVIALVSNALFADVPELSRLIAEEFIQAAH